MANAYATKAYSQGMKYAEIFFDPQSHTSRNITFEKVITGVREGLDKVKEEHSDFDYNLIMCFLRHLTEDDAFATYNTSLDFRNLFIGVGLDSSEVGHPPSKFQNVFNEAIKDGFHVVAHAGEEGPSSYIEEALDILHVERIDHGVHILDDANLTQRVADLKIPLTLCPLSNQKLQVVPDLKKYKLKEMMEKGLQTTVNSDDPSYFGGYIGDNFYAMLKNLKLTKEELGQLAINSFNSTFLENDKKEAYIQKVKEYLNNN